MSIPINCILVSDFHGKESRYQKFYNYLKNNELDYVFIAGDILPSLRSYTGDIKEFLDEIYKNLEEIKIELKTSFPKIFIIMGNDDPRIFEEYILEGEKKKLWYYINEKVVKINGFHLIGYSYVPPSPFLHKDWEKYDISRFTDVGCISPEEGNRTVDVDLTKIRYFSIKDDLDILTAKVDFSKAIFLFHSPPYQTNLDRAALDGKTVDSVPLDVHVGSIAIKKLIENNQPYLTMHGHIHESSTITGSWIDKIGKTICINASTEMDYLSIISFNLKDLNSLKREFL